MRISHTLGVARKEPLEKAKQQTTHSGSINTSMAVMKKRTSMQQQKAAPLRFSFSEAKCCSSCASTKRSDTALIW